MPSCASALPCLFLSFSFPLSLLPPCRPFPFPFPSPFPFLALLLSFPFPFPLLSLLRVSTRTATTHTRTASARTRTVTMRTPKTTATQHTTPLQPETARCGAQRRPSYTDPTRHQMQRLPARTHATNTQSCACHENAAIRTAPQQGPSSFPFFHTLSFPYPLPYPSLPFPFRSSHLYPAFP